LGRVHKRVALGIATVVVGVFASAGTASAAETLGQDFTPDGLCNEGTTYYTRSLDYVAPRFGGVITSWSFTAGTDALSGVELKVGQETAVANGMTTFATHGQAPPVDVPANTTRTVHDVRIPVQSFEHLGFYLGGTQQTFVRCADDDGTDVFSYAAGDSQPNTKAAYTNNADGQGAKFPVSATVEPDADGDGYGDETQDTCPTDASTQGTCPVQQSESGSVGTSSTSSGSGSGGSATATKDTTKPTIGGLSFSSTVFAAAKSGASIAKKAKVGTKVSFSVSEGSTVKFTVQRKTTGRRVGKKCKAQTKSNHKKKACTRWVPVKGSFSVRAGAGKNSFTFRGRVGGKSLKPGHYRLTGAASDSAKNTSLPKNKSFTIVP
jgi:hypothetical protein